MAKGTKTGGGSRKGIPNKNNQPLKEKFTQLLDGYSIGLMIEDLMSLDPLERLKIVTGLAEYIVPKLQRTDIKADVGGTVFNIGYGEKEESD